MESYLKIPVTFGKKGSARVPDRISIEESIKQFIEFIITTRQGECTYNPDFGYEIWSEEFEPIQNMMAWQPKFMDHVKYLLEKYENRIMDVQVWEPDIKALNHKNKSDKDYRITLMVDYRIRRTGEWQRNVKIIFEY